MNDRTNDQQGAQQHAEGEYGDRAREQNKERHQERHQERLHERLADVDETDVPTDRVGKHRIYEGREQHDEADKNREKNRLERDRDAGRAAE